MKKSALTVAVSLAMFSTSAVAIDHFLPTGRSIGYGSAGTTYAHWSAGANYNPALVGAAAGTDQDFFFVLNGVGMLTDISDDGDTVDVIDDFVDDVENFDEFNDVDLLEGEKSELQRIIGDSDSMINSVETLDGIGLRGGLKGNGAFGLAFERFAFSMHMATQFDVAGTAFVSDSDLALLRRYTELGQVLLDDVRPLFDEANRLESELLQKEQELQALIDSGNASQESIDQATEVVNEAEALFVEAELLADEVKNTQTTIENDFGDIFDQNTQSIKFAESDLDSSSRFVAIGWFEVGATIGSNFKRENGQTISYGITLKSVHLEFFDYQARASSFDDDQIDGDEVRNSTDFATADLGVIWSLDSQDKWRIGASVKNIVGEEISSNPIRFTQDQPLLTYKVEPQVRLGASYNTGWFRLAADVDVTESKGPTLEDGREFFKGSQYANLGVILNAWDFLELRAGYRQNLVSSAASNNTEESDGLVTVGAGLYLGGVQFDLGLQASPEMDDVGGGLQAMITW